MFSFSISLYLKYANIGRSVSTQAFSLFCYQSGLVLMFVLTSHLSTKGILDKYQCVLLRPLKYVR